MLFHDLGFERFIQHALLLENCSGSIAHTMSHSITIMNYHDTMATSPILTSLTDYARAALNTPDQIPDDK